MPFMLVEGVQKRYGGGYIPAFCLLSSIYVNWVNPPKPEAICTSRTNLNSSIRAFCLYMWRDTKRMKLLELWKKHNPKMVKAIEKIALILQTL